MFCISELITGSVNNVRVYTKNYGIFFFELGQNVSNNWVIPNHFKSFQVTFSKLDKAWHAYGCTLIHCMASWLGPINIFSLFTCACTCMFIRLANIQFNVPFPLLILFRNELYQLAE